MKRSIELAKQYGFMYQYPERKSTEMWCYEEDIEALYNAIRAEAFLEAAVWLIGQGQSGYAVEIANMSVPK